MKLKLHNIFTIKKVLSFLLLLSIVYAAHGIYYKVKYWGFTVSPKQLTDVWTVEAKVTFNAISDSTYVALAIPNNNDSFKILSEEIVAKGYKIEKNRAKNRLYFKGKNKKGKQEIYYRLSIYDDTQNSALDTKEPKKIKRPVLSDEKRTQMSKLWDLVKLQEGNRVQKAIKTINQEIINPSMSLVLPLNHTQKEFAEKVVEVLEYKRIPARIVRTIKLEEGRKTEKPDYMLEAYLDNQWSLYDLNTAKIGLPKNWVVFQRGGISLLDVSGGEDSKVLFSVLKSIATPMNLAVHKAKANDALKVYEYSIYNLPISMQNMLKWLMIFPLAILVVVIMRNVIGVSTMGTFTPMLLALSLVKTGFWPGMICFSVMILFGLLMRTLLARLNLLMVPRISFVVIFVILLIQGLTILGYRLDYSVVSSAIYFPIIITAWIIERASITWEKDGAKNTISEIFFTFITVIVTYFVISSEYVRHIMFAFNELNFVILFIVMLLGTYTGYRLTELMRFAPLIGTDDKNV